MQTMTAEDKDVQEADESKGRHNNRSVLSDSWGVYIYLKSMSHR